MFFECLLYYVNVFLFINEKKINIRLQILIIDCNGIIMYICCIVFKVKVYLYVYVYFKKFVLGVLFNYYI